MTPPKLTSEYGAVVDGPLVSFVRRVLAWASSEVGGWIIVAVLALGAIVATAAVLVLPQLDRSAAIQTATPEASATVPASVAQALSDFTLAPEAVQDISLDQARAWNAALPFSSDPIRPAQPFFASPADIESYSRALDCLTTAVYYEAASETSAGQAAVAQVVLNRARHPAYPRTVCGVVFQGAERATGCQFSFTCDGAMARPPSAAGWARARAIATSALNGHVAAGVGTATHYHTDWVAPYWAPRLSKIAMIGTHIFYRWKGGWGLPSAFTGVYSGSEPVVAKMAALSTLRVETPAEVLEVSAPTILQRWEDGSGGAVELAVPTLSREAVERDVVDIASPSQEIAPPTPVRHSPIVQRDVPIMADPMANPASAPTRQRQRIAAPSGW